MFHWICLLILLILVGIELPLHIVVTLYSNNITSGFLPGIFSGWGKSIVMLTFLVFLDQILGELKSLMGANLLGGCLPAPHVEESHTCFLESS